MSGLANQFVTNGELDIYQETYERLKSKFDRLQSSTTSKATTDSTFDMYGDSDITSSINKSTDTNSKKKLFTINKNHLIFLFSFIKYSLGIYNR